VPGCGAHRSPPTSALFKKKAWIYTYTLIAQGGLEIAYTESFLIFLNTQTNMDLRNTTLVYGFLFEHRNSRTFAIESLAHDSGRTLLSAKYGYLKGSPNTNG
jgi:hypothetical protein